MTNRWLRWPVIDDRVAGEAPIPLRARLLWMAGIWAASIAVLFAVALAVRWALKG